MTRDIDLTSQAWCDLVFVGKNQKYGAYYLRKTSTKRHITALLIVLAVGCLALALPFVLKMVVPEKTVDVALGPIELSNLDNLNQKPPDQNTIKQLEAPPPPLLKATIKFTPPVIKKDEEVREEEQMKTQEELTDTKAAISVATVEGVTEGGVDIADLRDNKVVVQAEKEQIFEHVEQMPEYPGGQGELMKYLSDKIRYPQLAQEQGIQGQVILRFVVGRDGSVSDVKVVRSLDPSCDKEAVRVVQSMPKWVPGKQNGNPVLVYFTLPVRFKLAN